jgi:uncharacterized membrane protein YdjX (TVP38/TMEM64 family)
MLPATRRRHYLASVPQHPGQDSPFLSSQAAHSHVSKENKRTMTRHSHTFLPQAGLLFARSFFPLFAIAIIAGTTLWGPWVSFAVTVLAITAALRLI